MIDVKSLWLKNELGDWKWFNSIKILTVVKETVTKTAILFEINCYCGGLFFKKKQHKHLFLDEQIPDESFL